MRAQTIPLIIRYKVQFNMDVIHSLFSINGKVVRMDLETFHIMGHVYPGNFNN